VHSLWPEVQQKLQLALKANSNNICALYNYARLLDYIWQEGDLAEQMYVRAITVSPR
jgi:hypothetical protein